MKKTVIVGSGPNHGRYAYLAAERLHQHGYEFVPLGIRKGVVIDKPILDIRTKPPISDVDTITLYIAAWRQPEWMDYLLSLKPRRIIFNPGTENPDFEKEAVDAGIEVVQGCTLVMLRSGQY